VRAKDRNYGACGKPSCHDSGNNNDNNRISQSSRDQPGVDEYVTYGVRHVASRIANSLSFFRRLPLQSLPPGVFGGRLLLYDKRARTIAHCEVNTRYARSAFVPQKAALNTHVGV